MGLDQTAFIRKEGEKDTTIMTWRKHANLEGWMHELYRDKGNEGVFNQEEVSLTKEDLTRLMEENNEGLDEACGFFWGVSDEEDKINTTLFIIQALEALEKGYEVIYTSWW